MTDEKQTAMCEQLRARLLSIASLAVGGRLMDPASDDLGNTLWLIAADLEVAMDLSERLNLNRDEVL